MIETLKSEGKSINTVCKILKISRSKYYRKKESSYLPSKTITQREQLNQELLEIIKQIRSEHLFWGYRRIRAYIKQKHLISVSYNRIYRIMKNNKLLLEMKQYKAKRTPQK